MKRLGTHRVRALVAAALSFALAGPACAVTSPSGIDSRLSLDWDVVTTRAGRPQIQGYIYNEYMRAANNVRLLVETLDGEGRVIDRAYGFVVGIVPVFNRAPFDVPLKTAGASYRIRVTSFEWRDGGGAAADSHPDAGRCPALTRRSGTPPAG